MLDEVGFRNFFAYAEKPPTHEQETGIGTLYKALQKRCPDLLDPETKWIRQFREKPVSTTFTPDSGFSFHITPHFTYGEFCNQEDIRRFTNQGQCEIALELAQFLEKAREKFGPLHITSGHRPPAVNAAVGGAAQSEHLYQAGCGAVDVYPISDSVQSFEDWVDQEWPYSVGYGASYRGFVHIGIRFGRPRVRWDY